MRKAAILVIVLAAVAFAVGRAATPVLVGHADEPIGNRSVTGPYAWSFTSHNPVTGGEGGGAGAMVFDGAGGVTGEQSQNFNCTSCGVQQLTRAPFVGTYVVYPDASVTLTLCVTIPSTTTTVSQVLEGAFSNDFKQLRFVQTTIASPCGSTGAPSAFVTTGTAAKL